MYGIDNILQLKDYLNHILEPAPAKPNTHSPTEERDYIPDFSQVKGQLEVKRALEIAAAGGHNILLIDPPGSGKSMLAKRVPSILPDMSFDEMIETTKIHSIAGTLKHDGLITTRPFRSPHHTAEEVRELSDRVRFHLQTTVCCFLTSCPNFQGRRLRYSVSRLRTALSQFQDQVSKLTQTISSLIKKIISRLVRA